MTTDILSLNPSQFPISRYRSNVCLVHQDASYHVRYPDRVSPFGEGLYLRSCLNQTDPREIMKIEFVEDADSDVQAEGFPGGVVLRSGNATLEVYLDRISGQDHVRLVSIGTGIRLRVPIKSSGPNYDHAVRLDEKSGYLNLFRNNNRFRFECLDGEMTFDAPWGSHHSEYITLTFTGGKEGGAEVALDSYSTVFEPTMRTSVEDIQTGLETEWNTFIAAFPAVPDGLPSKRFAEAAMVCWNNTIAANGNFTRDAVVMSKHIMSNVWSWDNCFNAMALAESHPVLAWDQLLLMADHQDRWGAFPDSVNADRVSWNFCKAPVYGFAFTLMLDRNPEFFGDRKRLETAYEFIGKNARWWLDHRRLPGHALPYLSHGNDGFDTSTMFLEGCPLEGPDVAAYLADQCKALALVANRLGLKGEAVQWWRQHDDLLQAMVDELWDEEAGTFVSKKRDGETVRCLSSQMLIPILLGRQLPPAVLSVLVERVREFATPHGMPSEKIDSPLYEPDGHCRGPIWAPTTFFIAHGCRRAGEEDLAAQIERGYCAMLEDQGFFECFDAEAGKGLRELAYSWTANVYQRFLLDADAGIS